MRMETNTRVVGLIIKGMGKVHSGSVMLKANLEDNIQEIGKMIRKKEEVRCSSKMEIDTMVCGWIANHMAKAE